MADHLSVVDSRTGKRYNIPIRDNAVEATDFGQINDGDGGLKMLDVGLRNTAVVRTRTTNMYDCWYFGDC